MKFPCAEGKIGRALLDATGLRWDRLFHNRAKSPAKTPLFSVVSLSRSLDGRQDPDSERDQGPYYDPVSGHVQQDGSVDEPADDEQNPSDVHSKRHDRPIEQGERATVRRSSPT